MAKRFYEEQSAVPYGLRKVDQRLVRVDEVPRGANCGSVCPSCKRPLVARQGDINDWHFAHTSENPGCGETYLHYAGKYALYRRIETALSSGLAIPMVYECDECGERHEVDLARRIAGCVVEARTMGPYKPDVTMWSKKETIGTIGEIFVSNPPQKAKIEYAINHNINVLVLKLATFNDIEAILDLETPLLPWKVIAPCMAPHIDMYIGVSVRPNPGPGGWGVVWVDGRARRTGASQGVIGWSTPFEVALVAIARGLASLESRAYVTLHVGDANIAALMNQGSWLTAPQNSHATLRRAALNAASRHHLVSATRSEMTLQETRRAKSLATRARNWGLRSERTSKQRADARQREFWELYNAAI